MRPDDRIRVLHRREAIEAAVDFIDGRDRGDLNGDRQLLFAIVRAIEVAGKPPPGFRRRVARSLPMCRVA